MNKKKVGSAPLMNMLNKVGHSGSSCLTPFS